MRDQEILDLSEAYASIYNTISESHFGVGDKVTCKESGMKGEVVKVDPKEEGKYYTVEREDGKKMKYAPDELKKSNGGASKGNEEKFHSKLDKLVHKTFGKSPEEAKESFDLFDTILEHLVSEGFADTNEAALAIMANMSEAWIGSIVEAVDPDYTGPSQDPLSRASRAIGNAVKFATGQQAAEVRAKQKGVPGNVVVKQSGPFSTKNVPTKGSFISDTEMRRRGQSTQPMGPIGK
jgi:hypothetical protein